MNKIQIYNQQAFNKIKQFESRDLSYSLLQNINFKECVNNISFFRSDFRGTKFENVKFFKNNFDRSDFLNSVFIKCSFEKVNFGCCQIKNCYFEDIIFNSNLYRNTSIHSTTFINCEFPDETFLINMQHCKLINCTFSGCGFEMSTTDSNEFIDCSFVNTNLATMHAESHTFINCYFDNVFLGSSYYFGYLITKCYFKNVSFLYRGEYVDLNSLKSNDLLDKFIVEHRYTEIINILKTYNRENDIPMYVKKAMSHYTDYTWGRMLDISNIFKTLIFSAIYEEISFNVLYNILVLFEKESFLDYSFDERNEILSLCIKFKNALLLSQHNDEYLLNINPDLQAIVTFNFSDDDYDKCINISNRLINSVSNVKYWELVDKKKGSWILFFSVSAFALISALPRIIKNYSDIYFDIKVKKAISKKLLEELNSSKSLSKTKKINDSLCASKLLMPSGKCINENEIKNIKSIKIEI